MSMLQIGLLGVAGALLAIQFKGGKTEYGIYICAGISLIIFLGILSRLTVVLDIMEEIAGYIDLAPAYTGMLIKMLGITYAGMPDIRRSHSRLKFSERQWFWFWDCR